MTLADYLAVITAICAVIAAFGTLAGLFKLWAVAHSVNGMKEAQVAAAYKEGKHDEQDAERKDEAKVT